MRDDKSATAGARYVAFVAQMTHGRQRVLQVAAGGGHTLLLTEGGEVVSFGCGENGQLGHGSRRNEWFPRFVEASKGLNVTSMSAGALHSVLLTNTGSVYTFGHGRWGQLGHAGILEDIIQPTRVEAFERSGKGERGEKGDEGGGGGSSSKFGKVVSAEAGGRHTLFRTAAGKVLVCGCGASGQLGGKTELQDYDAPAAVDGFGAGGKNARALVVAAGSSHSVVTTDGHELQVRDIRISSALGGGYRVGCRL